MRIREQLTTEVVGDYDVIVCGGGFAGMSAALAAVRQGKNVLLIDSLYMVGGLGTAGLIRIYLPICDGYGKQVSFGIAEEWLRLSVAEGAEGFGAENWLQGGSRTKKDQRFRTFFNPHLYAVLAEQRLHEEGVTLLYGTKVVGVDMQDGKIKHVIVENKSGRVAYAAKSVVDATGDCDVAHYAGLPTATFQQRNVLAGWYATVEKGRFQVNQLGAADIPDEEKTEEQKLQPQGRRFSGLEGEEITEFMRLSHQFSYENYRKRQKEDGDQKEFALVATMPQLRMTRKLVGEYELAESEQHTYFEDSIGMISNWKQRGPVYEVPFRTLYNASVKNLITAGRCISVDENMWDVSRVIPCCSVTGEAAGIAAAMTDDFSTLDVKALQEKLVAAGVKLHEKDL